MSEEHYKESILLELQEHFHIRRDVLGLHFSGKKLLIDAIVKPKNNEIWKNKNIQLGIEFKDDIRISGDTKNYTKWLAQCVDYANTEWEDAGYIYIFACPSLINGIPELGRSGGMGWLLPRIMSHLGIGELINVDYYGLTFIMQSTHRIWSIRNGIEGGARWKLERKFGSR